MSFCPPWYFWLNNVNTLPDARVYMSTAHGEADVTDTVAAIGRAFATLVPNADANGLKVD
jgi:hypothetical protein